MEINLEPIEPFLQIALVLVGAFLAASVISIVVWTARDIRSRSRDIFVQLLSVLLVLVFNLPGLLLYFILRPRETLADEYERLLEEETLLQELEGKQACPYCHLRVEDDFLFCPGCHAQLRKTCMSCGRLMHLRWDLCPYCGYEETSTEEQAVFPPRVPEEEEMRPLTAVGEPTSPAPIEPVPAVLSDQTSALADEETVLAHELAGSPEEETPPIEATPAIPSVLAEEETVPTHELQGSPEEETPPIEAAPAIPSDQASELTYDETVPAHEFQGSPEGDEGSTLLETSGTPAYEETIEETTSAPTDSESA